MNNLKILYEDNHIIVVIKPNNILSQADSTEDIDMLNIVKKYIKQKYNKPGNVYLGLVQRLDRPVSGIMIFARSSKAASRLVDDIRMHKINKKYLAVIRGTSLSDNGIFTDYLLKEDSGNTIVTDEKHGKYSELQYQVLEKNYKQNLSLLEIDLKTGRHHQIRVQFSSRKLPLYGDQRYGIQDNKQIALHAYKLEFIHPVKKEKMEFTYMPEKNNCVWSLFNLTK